MTTTCIVALVLIFAVPLAIMAVLAKLSPLGEEIPFVGFVRTDRKK